MKTTFQVVNIASEPEAEIRVIGPIGESFWDETRMHEKAFREALDLIPAERRVRVLWNSEGGAVRDGLGIYHAMKSRRPGIRSVITGYCMSAASFAALGGETVETPEGAVWMLHKPSTYQEGNADDMRKTAEMLDAHERAMVDIYVAETGKTEDEVIKALREETYLSGKEAVEWGLADIQTSEPVALAQLDKSRYRRLPAALCGATPPNNKGTKMKEDTKTEAGTVTNAPDVLALTSELAMVKAQLEKERKDRIERVLDQCVADDRITIAQRADWLPKCIKDEELLGLVKAIEPKPKTIAVDQRVKGVGTVDDEYLKIKPGAERIAFRRPRFDDIVAIRRGSGGVSAANTIAAALLPDTVADALIVALTTRLASFNAFSRDYSTNAMAPLSTVQVRKATSGSTLQTNPTNWESGNSVIDAIPVTIAQKAKSFHIANSELNSGHKIENLAQVNANEFAVSLSELATAVMLVGDYGAGTNIGAAANFATDDLPAILALAKNYNIKNLLLDGAYTARLQALNAEGLNWQATGAFGFDGIFVQNTYTGATANTVGFVCDPDAIAVATGLPVTAPAAGGDVQQSVVTLPDNGLSVQVNLWFSRATRTTWVSYDIMIGAAKGDTAKAEILLSA